MILGFKIKLKSGEPTGFVEKIEDGRKIHSMRKGHRWKVGMSIQFATGVRTKKYRKFKEGVCTCVQYVTLYPRDKRVMMYTPGGRILDDRYSLSDAEIELLARNDGFDSVEDFWEWFDSKKETYQLIHWTGFKY